VLKAYLFKAQILIPMSVV